MGDGASFEVEGVVLLCLKRWPKFRMSSKHVKKVLASHRNKTTSQGLKRTFDTQILYGIIIVITVV